MTAYKKKQSRRLQSFETDVDLTIAEKTAIEQWLIPRIGDALDDSLGYCFMRSSPARSRISTRTDTVCWRGASCPIMWHEGYYSRVIRDTRELTGTIDYVLANPAKAGLLDWPFAAAYPERLATLLSEP